MNIAEPILDIAHRYPEKLALVMGADTVTYRELWDLSGRIAEALTEVGVTTGDRVLMLADNSPNTFVLYLAAVRIGAIFAPVHIAYDQVSLAYVFDNAQAAVLFVDDVGSKVAQACELDSARPSLVVHMNDIQSFAQTWKSHGGALQQALVEVSPTTPALIAYRSLGNSDRPLPVTRSHSAELWNCVTYQRVWDVDEDDRVLNSLPLSWVYGLSTVGLTALCAGATVVLQSIHETEPLLPAIDSHRITIFAGTMSMYSRMLGEAQGGTFDCSSLSHLYIGGEQLVVPVLNLVEYYTGTRPLQAYATTEVAPVLAVDPKTQSDAPANTLGKLIGGSEIRLVDSNGEDVEEGEVGEAWLRGNGAMLGYWNEPDLDAARLTLDGWYKSGDYLWRNAEGYYFMFRRNEDVIIRDGTRIVLSDVEAAIADIDGVEDVVVVAVPDDDFGEALIAFVVGSPSHSLSIDTLYEALGFRVARTEMPRELYVLNEFPLDVAGKRDRKHLRAFAQERQSERNTVITIAGWQSKRPGSASSA